MDSRLLEILAEKYGCYISELKYSNYFVLVISFLRHESIVEFTLDELNYALSYIFDKNLNFTAYSKIENYISEVYIKYCYN